MAARPIDGITNALYLNMFQNLQVHETKKIKNKLKKLKGGA